MRETLNPSRLPPHLSEVCAILAAGLVRLRRHTAEEVAGDAARVGGEAEISLHFRSDQSGMRSQFRGETHDPGARSALHPTIATIPPTDVLRRLAALERAPTADLKQQWRELFGKEPPAFSRTYLQSRLAYRIQELAYGGLKPETVARLEALGEKLDGGNITLRRIRADDRPIAGTRLVREYQGVEHVVTVLAGRLRV